MTKLILEFDPNVYRLEAVKKAGYRVGDRYFVEIEAPLNGHIKVALTAKPGVAAASAIEGEFRNEVLDQELRESIAQETEAVRNLLLAQAFSGISLTDSVGESADYRDDPLGISPSQVTER